MPRQPDQSRRRNTPGEAMEADHRGTRTAGPRYAGIGEALSGGRSGGIRPLCLCVPGGVPMYVARFGTRHLVKRMPLSGNRHAPGCPHYEAPEERAGHAAGPAAAREKAESLRGTLTADAPAPTAEKAENATPRRANGDGFSLLRMLHELWVRAELTRWHPGFAGKRHWGVVRRHLLAAARRMATPSGPLAEHLYVPEVFSVERAEKIRERREAAWRRMLAPAAGESPLMFVVGELKALQPGQHRARAWLKHLPDRPLMLSKELARRTERRYAALLGLWDAAPTLHMVMAGAVALDDLGAATVIDAALMASSPEWISVEDAHDVVLVERLVEDRRSFKKLMGEQNHDRPTATALLTDMQPPVQLFIDRCKAPVRAASGSPWTWLAARDHRVTVPSKQRLAAPVRSLPGTPSRQAAATVAPDPEENCTVQNSRP